jgi:uncharacterized protein with GYD domain
MTPSTATTERVEMFTYIGLIQLTEPGREHLEKVPEHIAKFREIVEKEGGKVERLLAFMGPWDFVTIVKFPDNEVAFRVLAKVAKLEYLKTETFPAEEVELFVKTFI